MRYFEVCVERTDSQVIYKRNIFWLLSQLILFSYSRNELEKALHPEQVFEEITMPKLLFCNPVQNKYIAMLTNLNTSFGKIRSPAKYAM